MHHAPRGKKCLQRRAARFAAGSRGGVRSPFGIRASTQGKAVVPAWMVIKNVSKHVSSARSHLVGSMDWFKGKSTGNHGFYHQITVFPVNFPIIQFYDWWFQPL